MDKLEAKKENKKNNAKFKVQNAKVKRQKLGT
jgi:hypothetical protein